ncbi:MAG: hypothetical protein MJ109_04860 [Kiritimatiellae bacterium]|nr:hypothetical protein [Kiritimatiellia bacterium]
MRKYLAIVLGAFMLIGGFAYEVHLARVKHASPALAESAFAALGGVRAIIAEVVWFRADRLQEEGRYVELRQLAETLTLLEPHTPEIWSYAAWNLAYNISIMMPTDEDRWRWVEAAIRLLRDRGLKFNPGSREICRELAWLFELKLGGKLDQAAPTFRTKWKAIVEDVKSRDAWEEIGMEKSKMDEIERITGFNDWADPQMSAMYWAKEGGFTDIFTQAKIIYQRTHNMIQYKAL